MPDPIDSEESESTLSVWGREDELDRYVVDFYQPGVATESMTYELAENGDRLTVTVAGDQCSGSITMLKRAWKELMRIMETRGMYA